MFGHTSGMDVLTQFAQTELEAMRLDGVLFRVHGSFVIADEPDTVETRIAIARAAAPRQFILDRLSAAWVWGAIALPPPTPDFCLDMNHRGTDRYNAHRAQRYVRLDDTEVVSAPAGSVLSPWRTTLHLLRWTPGVSPDCIRNLLGTIDCCPCRAAERIRDERARSQQGQFLRPLLELFPSVEPMRR